jgi:methyl-accepting chemotaxis protein
MFGRVSESLRTKLSLVFSVVLVAGCLALWYEVQIQADKALEAEATEAMLKVAKQLAETQESRNQARTYAVETIANRNVIRGKSGDREATLEEKLGALRNEAVRGSILGFKEFVLADREGNAYSTSGVRANVADRAYFKPALAGKTVVSSTLVSKSDQSIIFVIATPVRHYATNEITGVLIGVVDAMSMSALVGSVSYARTGYAFAVDGTGKTIAHKDIERVRSQENVVEQAKSDPSLASLAAVVSKMAAGEEGVGRYTFLGQDMIVAYAPVKSAGWSVAVVAPEAEVLARSAGVKRSVLVISAIIIVVALALVLVLARSMTAPLALAVGHLGAMADGDFARPIPEKFLRLKDEVGRLVRSIVELQARMKPLLAGLKEDAKTLAQGSEALGAASEEIAASSGEVAKAIQQVAAGASDQSNHLQDILSLIQNITASLEKVYTELGKVKANSEETSRLAEVGKKELDLLVKSIRDVREAFKVVTERLSALSGSVNQIGEILEVINGIADQTNLLALNAAIEAARAGEAGRGFAVVADEVRKLAEQSRASSDKIGALLANIGQETIQVVKTSEEMRQQVVSQLENAEKTIKAFDDILQAVEGMAPMIEATYREVDGTVRAKDVVLDRVQSVSAVAEEAAASAEEISASAEELSASTQEIASTAQEVMKVAKRLEEQAERFKI